MGEDKKNEAAQPGNRNQSAGKDKKHEPARPVNRNQPPEKDKRSTGDQSGGRNQSADRDKRNTRDQGGNRNRPVEKDKKNTGDQSGSRNKPQEKDKKNTGDQGGSGNQPAEKDKNRPVNHRRRRYPRRSKSYHSSKQNREPYIKKVSFKKVSVVIPLLNEEEFDVLNELLKEEGWVLLPVSVKEDRNMEEMLQFIIREMRIIRVYSKRPHEDADMSQPFILHSDSTVGEVAEKVHKDFIANLKTARIWGKGVRDGQMVGKDHNLHDGDVVELHI